MELFQGKESSKEKVDLNNNSETHDQIIIRIIIRISKKNVEFCGGKHLSFYPKGVCSFSVFFYLNEEELGQQVCLIKYVDNETSYSSIPLAKKKEKGREREREREREAKTQSNFKNISKTSEKLPDYHKLTNYDKLSLI